MAAAIPPKPLKLILKNQPPSARPSKTNAVKKAVEEVFGQTKLNGLLPNFPIKGATSIGYISNRPAAAADINKLVYAFEDLGYKNMESGIDPNDEEKIAGVSVTNGAYTILVTFKIGEKDIQAIVMSAQAAAQALKE